MAARPMGYGLSRELAEKNAAKYSADDEVIFENDLENVNFFIPKFVFLVRIFLSFWSLKLIQKNEAWKKGYQEKISVFKDSFQTRRAFFSITNICWGTLVSRRE